MAASDSFFQNLPLSTDLATQDELEALSSEVVNGLSDTIAPKLSIIADLVEEEVAKTDALSGRIEDLNGAIDEKLSGVSMNGEAVEVVDGVATLGTVLTEHQSLSDVEILSGEMVDGLSVEVLPKLDVLSGLVKEEVKRIDELSGEMSAYAKKEDVPTKTSDLDNDSDFVTMDEVDSATSGFAEREELSAYAQLSDVGNVGDLSAISVVYDPMYPTTTKKILVPGIQTANLGSSSSKGISAFYDQGEAIVDINARSLTTYYLDVNNGDYGISVVPNAFGAIANFSDLSTYDFLVSNKESAQTIEANFVSGHEAAVDNLTAGALTTPGLTTSNYSGVMISAYSITSDNSISTTNFRSRSGTFGHYNSMDGTVSGMNISLDPNGEIDKVKIGANEVVAKTATFGTTGDAFASAGATQRREERNVRGGDSYWMFGIDEYRQVWISGQVYDLDSGSFLDRKFSLSGFQQLDPDNPYGAYIPVFYRSL